MKLLALLLLFAGANAQLHESLRTRDSVLFTFFNKATTKAYLQYSPADPKKWKTSLFGGFQMDTLLATSDGKTGEYWGLTASYETGQIFVNNLRAGTLLEVDVNKNELKVLFEDLARGLQDLAFDRVTKSLYFTDSIRKEIVVIDETYRHFSPILQFSDVSPYALTLHVTKRILFYSVYKLEHGFISKSKLIRCDLDGQNNVAIVDFPDVIRVHGMTIDYSDDRLYWTDMTRDQSTVVMTSFLDGSGRKVFYTKKSGFLWGIAHYKNLFYVADLVNNTQNEYEIHVRYKDFNEDQVIYKNLRPRNVAIYAPNEVSKTKVTNECSKNECDQICVASSKGRHTCKCSPGYTLEADHRCETESLTDSYLVVADGAQKRLFEVALSEDANVVDEYHAVPLDNVTDSKIYAMTVDPANGDLVWFDLANDKIMWGDKSFMFSEDDAVIASFTKHPCEDTIYFATFSRIYSLGYRDYAPTMIYKLPFLSEDEIRDVAFDAQRNHLYWTQHDSIQRASTVMRKDLDGGKAEMVLKSSEILKSLRIDCETYTLYAMTMVAGEVYALPLKLLGSIPSTSPAYNGYKTIEFGPYLENQDYLIFDFDVVDGMMYLVDALYDRVARFNLNAGPSSIEDYGPPDLRFPTTISFFQKQFYNKHIASKCPSYTTPGTTTSTEMTTSAYIPATTSEASVLDCSSLLEDPSVGFAEFWACIVKSLGP